MGRQFRIRTRSSLQLNRSDLGSRTTWTTWTFDLRHPRPLPIAAFFNRRTESIPDRGIGRNSLQTDLRRRDVPGHQHQDPLAEEAQGEGLDEDDVANAVQFELVGALGDNAAGNAQPLGGDVDDFAAPLDPTRDGPGDWQQQDAGNIEPEIDGGGGGAFPDGFLSAAHGGNA